MGRDLGRWPLCFLVISMLICGACGGDGLDGPERSLYEGVSAVEMSVERGDVKIYGSNQVVGAVVDRWMSLAEDFAELTQTQEGSRLIVAARCAVSGGCQTRHTLSVEPSVRLDLAIEKGDLELIRAAGPIRAVVDKGDIKTWGLTSDSVEIHIKDGRGRIEFAEPPGSLLLRIERGQATVLLPEQRYRCDFNRHAPEIGLNGLRCHESVGPTITLDPPNARVRFEVVDRER